MRGGGRGGVEKECGWGKVLFVWCGRAGGEGRERELVGCGRSGESARCLKSKDREVGSLLL